MPSYEYVCVNCGTREIRITGIDDHTVICDDCRQVMVRKMDVKSLLDSYQEVTEQA